MAVFLAIALAFQQAVVAPPIALDARWVGAVRHAAGGARRLRCINRIRSAQRRPTGGGRSRSRHRALAARRRHDVDAGDRRRHGLHHLRARRSRRATRKPARSDGARRCPAAPPRHSTGTPAGCWRRRRPAISRRFALPTARWCGASRSAPRSSTAPAPALDRLYLPLTDGRLVAVSLATGETIWTQRVTGRITALVGLDDQLVFGTTGKYVVSVDLQRGRERWSGGSAATSPGCRWPTTSGSTSPRATTCCAPSIAAAATCDGRRTLPSRPAGGPLRLPIAVLVPLVSSEISAFEPETGKALAADQGRRRDRLAAVLPRRARGSPLPRLITVSRDGQLQGIRPALRAAVRRSMSCRAPAVP